MTLIKHITIRIVTMYMQKKQLPTYHQLVQKMVILEEHTVKHANQLLNGELLKKQQIMTLASVKVLSNVTVVKPLQVYGQMVKHMLTVLC